VTPADRHERRRAATRRTIQEHALRLFLEQGFEETTVEQVAAAAGVSHMTFFRHFPSKADVVEQDEYDPMLVELIATRPIEEQPLTAVHRALRQGLEAVLAEDRAAILTRSRLVFQTPSLRARAWRNEEATRHLVAEALGRRDGASCQELALQVLAGAAVAAITAAISSWVATDGADDLVVLVDEAFEALGVPSARPS